MIERFNWEHQIHDRSVGYYISKCLGEFFFVSFFLSKIVSSSEEKIEHYTGSLSIKTAAVHLEREKKNPHIREELTRPDKTGLIMFCFTEPNGELAKWFL